MDLSKLSDADLDALHSGDMSKVSDEGLEAISSQPDSQPSMPPEPSLKGGGSLGGVRGTVSGVGEFLFPGFSEGQKNGAIQAASLGNINPSSPTEAPEGRAVGRLQGTAAIAAAGGGLAAAPETALGRIGAQTAISGAQGFLQKPAGDDSLGARAKAGGLSALLGGGLQTLGEGASGIGDYLMQRAVGMKKYIPGMGKKLADEGVIGTKGMMRNQVDAALPQREAELRSAVNDLSGTIPPDDTAQALRDTAKSYIPEPGPSGPMPVPSQNQPFVDAAHARADEAMARGALAPSEALSVSRAVAKPAYSQATGDPLNSFKAKLGQTEGGSLKDALKNLADDQGKPQVRDALAQEAALLNAQRGLNRPESLASILGRLGTKAAVGGGAGYLVGGKEGAVAGALMSTPLGQSSVGRLGIAAGRAAPYAVPALIDALHSAKRDQ